ncbi:MAG: 3'-5' exonuclease [Spirochaetales bacterium]|nr:3'-5' exonuclease [Spirochaetales bacterium]
MMDIKKLTFTAIDFETANYKRTSACQIGIVVVKDNIIIEEFSSYIKPVPNYFLRYFTDDIHGIDEETVEDAPTFPELWEIISGFIENTPMLVAHNAVFDKGVLNACLDYHNIKANIPYFFCTVQGSRKKLPSLRNHKLSTVCSYYGIPLNHHEALSDARGAAGIALALNKEKLKK